MRTISDKEVRRLRTRVKNTEVSLFTHWKEGLSNIDVIRYSDDIKDFISRSMIRYWKTGDSYIFADFKDPYYAFCITKPYIEKNYPNILHLIKKYTTVKQ